MRRSGTSLAALTATGILFALPAFGQNSPESLLPPGFGEQPETNNTVAAPVEEQPPAAGDNLPNLALDLPAAPAAVPIAPATPPAAAPDELPAAARRPIDVVGPLDAADTGLGTDAFGTADGRFLAMLMQRIDAPVASRWMSIVLRRALLSHVSTPGAINPADWIAERAWLLLRMGEADGARMLVQNVDVDHFTPRMYAIAAQTALATADPAGLCPIAEVGETLTDEPIWPLARAMCASLSGDAANAGVLLDSARSDRIASAFDRSLAEKIVGAGAGGRRVVAIDWIGVDRLTVWRFGLASAAGVAIPDELWPTAGPQVQAWFARAPMTPLEERVGPARTAAALGVFSSAALVDLYGAVADETDPFALQSTDAGRLRQAYVGDSVDSRIAALRHLWDSGTSPRDSYAGAILTARAAARLAPDASLAPEAAQLVAAMLSAGLDRQAARWARIVDGMGPANADRAWSLLAVGAPSVVVDTSRNRVEGFARRTSPLKAKMLIAALAGLGRLSPADSRDLAERYALPLADNDRWSRALAAAMIRHQPGTVAVIAAAGMQTPGWNGVPPAYLFHILTALRGVGREPEARMIAAEAMTRL